MAKREKQPQFGGLYAGDAGDFAADQNRLPYYNAMLSQAGINPGSQVWQYMQDDGFGAILGAYQNAQAGDEQLKYTDFMSQVYGQDLGGTDGMNTSGFQQGTQLTGKKGKGKGKRKKGAGNTTASPNNPFMPGGGTGLAPTGATGLGIPGQNPNPVGAMTAQDAENMFLNFIASEQPQDYFQGELQRGGLVTPNTNPDYANFLGNQYFRYKYGDYMNQLQSDPNLSFRSFV